MSSPYFYLQALPLLPTTSIVYLPNRSATFEVSARSYCEKLFAYAKKETGNHIALAYPVDENGSDNGPVRHVVTVIKIEVCEPVVRCGEVLSWSIEASSGRRAEIVEELEGEEFRMAILHPMDEPEIELNFIEKLKLLMPIWVGLRLLVGELDCDDSALPSHGNVTFVEYLDNLQKLLAWLYVYLPLSYRDKVDFLAAKDVFERAQLTARFVNRAHEAGYRSAIIPVTLNEIRLLSPCCKHKDN